MENFLKQERNLKKNSLFFQKICKFDSPFVVMSIEYTTEKRISYQNISNNYLFLKASIPYNMMKKNLIGIISFWSSKSFFKQ